MLQDISVITILICQIISIIHFAEMENTIIFTKSDTEKFFLIGWADSIGTILFLSFCLCSFFVIFFYDIKNLCFTETDPFIADPGSI